MTRAILLGAFLLTVSAGQQAGVPQAGTAVISGRILSESDVPIAAATVHLATGVRAADVVRLLTDGEGRFVFSGLRAGSVRVTASKPGWLTGAYGRERPGGADVPIVLTEGQRQPEVNIRLWRGAVIAGRVVDQAGEPMVAVNVHAFRLSYPAGRQLPVFATYIATDDRGAYRFASLDPGDYLICVPATVTSEPSGFAGVARAQNGTPPAYLETMTAIGTAPAVSSDRASGVSNNDRWSLASVQDMPGTPPASGAWLTYPTTFAPSALTRGAAAVIHAEAGRERAGVDVMVALTPTYQVSGTLTSPDGPAAYYSVHLVAADSADAPVIDANIAVTDGAGAFTFFGVVPGAYIARVVRTPAPAGMRLAITGGTGALGRVAMLTAAPGAPASSASAAEPLLHVSQPVTVGDRDLRDLSLQLRPGVRVAGRVQFDGTPPGSDAMSRVFITLEPATGLPYPNAPSGRATATGEFTLPSSWPGRYLIRADSTPPGWRLQSAIVRGVDASATPIEITSDIDDVVVTLTEKAPTISGVVQFDGRPAKPIAAAVILFPADPKQWIDYGRTSRTVRSASVSISGTYTMPAPPDGDYLLVAIPDGQAADWSKPVVLQRLAEIAEAIQIRDAQPVTRTLTLRRLR